MKRTHNRMEQGSGIYNCTVCGRKTRSTGEDNTNLKQCAECYEVGGLENLISDEGDLDGSLQKRIDELNAIVVAKGGRL